MATLDNSQSALLSPEGEMVARTTCAAPAHMLRCLAVSASSERRELIRAAAEAEAWDAIVCRDAGEFLRAAFKHWAPLAVIDLPSVNSSNYGEMKNAVNHIREISQALVVVVGTEGGGEEVWARSSGAWAYFRQIEHQRGFRVAFSEARTALERWQFSRREHETSRTSAASKAEQH
jgi:hypothetical protein